MKTFLIVLGVVALGGGIVYVLVRRSEGGSPAEAIIDNGGAAVAGGGGGGIGGSGYYADPSPGNPNAPGPSGGGSPFKPVTAQQQARYDTLARGARDTRPGGAGAPTTWSMHGRQLG